MKFNIDFKKTYPKRKKAVGRRRKELSVII